MPAALLPSARPAQNPLPSDAHQHDHQTVPTQPPVPALGPALGGKKRPRQGSLDSLLNHKVAPARSPRPETAFEPENAPGIFLALRVAVLFNAGLGIAALLAYETWTMLAR